VREYRSLYCWTKHVEKDCVIVSYIKWLWIFCDSHSYLFKVSRRMLWSLRCIWNN
jgi:hypothetical protein